MSHQEAQAALDASAGSTETYAYKDEEREDILRMIPEDGKTIGSIGCGYATTEAVLVRQGREVHGVDVSEKAIETAKKRLTSARVIAPEERRVFEDESLDGLILADVIEHLPAAWEALAIYTRAVRPGGWVVISVPNMRSFNALYRLFIQGDWPENPSGIFDATHLQNMTKRRLERWCKDAGLTIDQWYDRYEIHRRRGRWLKTLDAATFRLFHDFMSFQIEGRWRKNS
jgi:2-polyprenyl-3-methyl-5-hydroxy-6-metoxy-1,4-benzoquinol methylase